MTDAELPDEAIEAAQDITANHSHEVGDDAGSLLAHLRSDHDLDAPAHLSGSTLQGLHDRLHDETGAADT
jgi:hypothetical protein